MSGLCLAAKLKLAGVDTFTLYEKGDRVGGTWRENTYPGVSCDVPSSSYQFTFSPNPRWSRLLSPGEEIRNYLDRVSAEFGLDRHIQLGVELTRCEFVDGEWQLFTTAGRVGSADFLVSAAGILHRPRYPDVVGLDDFAGAVFHSARWDHSVALGGQRVGVIGTGSTGVQIIAAVAKQVQTLTVFQRSAQWVLPLPNPGLSGVTGSVLRTVPGLGAARDVAMAGLISVFTEAVTHPGWQRRLLTWWARRAARSVRDPDLRAKLTPDFLPLCRRMVISSGYFRAIQRDNVNVETGSITRVVPEGVITGDGVLHQCDVLVLATGFDAQAFVRPMQLVGRGGVTIDQAWSDGPQAYKTVAQPGFPNYFTIMGPHSPVGNFPLTAIAETQADYILEWIAQWRAGRFAFIEPSVEAADRFNADVRAAAGDTIWATGCTGWYLGSDGVPNIWPWHPHRHRDMLATPDPTEFHLTREPDRSASRT
jgi:cation diffusion facilitator CzcD-associated flavoprotein CzcO